MERAGNGSDRSKEVNRDPVIKILLLLPFALSAHFVRNVCIETERQIDSERIFENQNEYHFILIQPFF